MRSLLILGLVLAFSFRASAATSTARIGNGFATNLAVARHGYTFSKGSLPNSTTVWVNVYDDGVLWSANTYWMQTNASGVLTVHLPGTGTTSTSPTSNTILGPLSGYDFGNTTVQQTKTRVFKNRDTGVILGSYSDTTNWIVDNTFQGPSTAQTYIYEMIDIVASGGTSKPKLATWEMRAVNASNVDHVQKLYVNGIERRTLTAPAATLSEIPGQPTVRTPGMSEAIVELTDVEPGSTWSYTTDGVATGSGTVTYVEGELSFRYDGPPLESTWSAPPEQPLNLPKGEGGTPAPTPTPPPSTPPPAGQGGVAGGTPISNTNDFYSPVKQAVSDALKSTKMTGDVSVLNTNDFYAPFKKALADQNAEVPTGNAPALPADPADFAETRKGIFLVDNQESTDEIQGAENKIEIFMTKLGELKESLLSKMPGTFEMPTIGTAYAMTFKVRGTTHTMDFHRFSSPMNIIRIVLLAIMVCTFWIMTVKTLRGALAN